MNDFAIGENVFVLVNNKTAVRECKIVGYAGPLDSYFVVEPLSGSDLSGSDRVTVECSIFRTKAKAWYAVAQKWAAIRDVAEANRAAAVDQTIL